MLFAFLDLFFLICLFGLQIWICDLDLGFRIYAFGFALLDLRFWNCVFGFAFLDLEFGLRIYK